MPRIPGEGLKLAKSLGDQPVPTHHGIYIYIYSSINFSLPSNRSQCVAPWFIGPTEACYISLLFVGKMFPFFFFIRTLLRDGSVPREEEVRWLSMKIKFIRGRKTKDGADSGLFWDFDGLFWKMELWIEMELRKC